MREIKYKPIAFFRMDDDSPFLDWSGYGRSATMSGTHGKGLPLTNFSAFSTRANSSSYPTYTVPRVVDNNGDSYSLSAVVYPVADATNVDWQAVVSRPGWNDGIAIRGTTIWFATVYSDSTYVTVTYDFEEPQKLDIVGTHSPTANRLFVNGELVAEVDILADTQAKGLHPMGTAFVTAENANRGSILINNVGFFNYALPGQAIKDIYDHNNLRSQGSPARGYQGEDVTFSRGIRPHYLSKTWDEATEWSQGVFDGSTIEGNVLNAQIEEGATINGWWTDSVYLKNADVAEPIDSINLDWSGENVIVQVGADEVNWENVKRGKNITTIPEGFVPTDQQLYVRAVFPAGQADAFLNTLRVDGYLEGALIPISGRTITFTKVVNRYEYPAAIMHDAWGATIAPGGSIAIGPDTDDSPLSWRSIEVWFKPADNTFFFDAGGNTDLTAVYTNGVSGNHIMAGEWNVMHLVYATGRNPTVNISGPSIVGKVAFYPTALTQAEVSKIISNYTGTYSIDEGSVGAVSVVEGATPALIIDHNWLTNATI